MKPGIYQHYKGPFYLGVGPCYHINEETSRILGEARHSETGEIYEVYITREGVPAVRLVGQEDEGGHHQFMLYVPLYPHTGPGFAIRPLEMFMEYVTVGDRRVPRFSYVGQRLILDTSGALEDLGGELIHDAMFEAQSLCEARDWATAPADIKGRFTAIARAVLNLANVPRTIQTNSQDVETPSRE